jgi:hypothetical protein
MCVHSHTLFPLGGEAVSGKGRDVVMAIPFSASERRGGLTTSLPLPSSFWKSERGHPLYFLLLLMKGCVRISSYEAGCVTLFPLGREAVSGKGKISSFEEGRVCP